MPRSMVRSVNGFLTIAIAAMLAAGCRDSGAPGPACREVEGQPTHIGAEGGMISLDGDAAVLTIPAGAVTTPCGIAVSIEAWIDAYSYVPWIGGARALFGTAYRIRAHDLSERAEKVRLALPATLTIRYDPANVPPGVSESELVLAQVTRVGCTPDLFGFGCSWDLAYRPVATSRLDVVAERLTGSLSCLDVCGGSADGTGDGTGEFLVMHPRCARYGNEADDPRWECGDTQVPE